MTWLESKIKEFKDDPEYLRESIDLLKGEVVALKDYANKRFAQGFKKGQESVRRKNKSGCCCIIDDDGNVVSVCGAHQDWLEAKKERT